MKTLTEQLKKQHQIKDKLELIESEVSEFLNQKEIFDKIKESLKYQFEVKNIVTNKYTIDLIPTDKNTYNLFIEIDEDIAVSSHIKLNNRKDRLKFKIATFKKYNFTTEDIIKAIQILIGE